MPTDKLSLLAQKAYDEETGVPAVSLTQKHGSTNMHTTKDWVTKPTSETEEFSTGAHRGSDKDRLQFAMIPLDLMVQMQRIYGDNDFDLKVDDSRPPLQGSPPYEESAQHMIPNLFINRLGGSYFRGIAHYGADNWKKGIPLLRIYGSLFRHMIQWFAGDTSEDHLAAIAWNTATLMFTEDRILKGELPEHLANAGPLVKWLKKP